MAVRDILNSGFLCNNSRLVSQTEAIGAATLWEIVSTRTKAPLTQIVMLSEVSPSRMRSTSDVEGPLERRYNQRLLKAFSRDSCPHSPAAFVIFRNASK